MKLITKSANNKLKKQYALGSDFSKQNAIIKIFNPYGKGTWYVVNTDPEDEDYLYGIAVLDEVEIGSFSRKELENLRAKPFNLTLERDTHFDEINAEKLYQMLLENRHKDFDASDIDFTESSVGIPYNPAKMEIVKDEPSQADIIMDLLLDQTRQRPYPWTIEQENYDAIYKGIQLCLSYDIPLFWIEKFVLGTMITTEGEKQGFPSPELVVIMPQFITEYFENFLESYGKSIFEAGWKYLEIDADILKNLGFSFYQTLRTEYGNYDTWLSNDLKSVFAYKNNGGGYMSFLSIDFAEGYNAANRITNACSYVKDVDYFFNGLGGISRDESLQIIIEALKNQAAQLTEYLQPSKMEHGGDIKKTYFIKDAQHNATSFNNISQHLQLPSSTKRQSNSHVGLSEKHRHPEAMLQKKNRGGNVDFKTELLEFTKKTNDLRVKRNSLIKGTPSHTALQNEIDERESLVIRDKNGNTIGLKKLEQGGDLQDLDIANSDLFAKGGQLPDFLDKLEKTPNGIPYTDNIASPEGANFIIYPLGFTKTDIDDAKRWLRNQRDVLSLRIASDNDYYEAYEYEIFRHPKTKPLKWYQINVDETLIKKAIKNKISVDDYVETYVLPKTAETEAKARAKFQENVDNLEQGGDLQDLDIANSDLFAKGGYNKIHRADSKSNRELYMGEIAFLTNTSRNAVRDFADQYSLSDAALLKITTGIGRNLISKKDAFTAIIGDKNNPYAKEIVKFSKSDAAYRIDKSQFSETKEADNDKPKYIPPYEVATIKLKNGQSIRPTADYESYYNEPNTSKDSEGFNLMSGIYYSNNAIRKEDQNQLELFKAGGKMPESAKYYKYDTIESVTTLDGDVINGNQIYNGLWISNELQKAFIQKRFKEKDSNRSEKKNPVTNDNFKKGGGTKIGNYAVVNKIQRDKKPFYIIVNKNISKREAIELTQSYKKFDSIGWQSVPMSKLNESNSQELTDRSPLKENEYELLNTPWQTIAKEMVENDEAEGYFEARNKASKLKKEISIRNAIFNT